MFERFTRVLLAMATVAVPSMASAQLVQFTDGAGAGSAFFTLVSAGSSAVGCTAPSGAPSCGSTTNLAPSSTVIATAGLSAQTFRLLTSYSLPRVNSELDIKAISLQLYGSTGVKVFSSQTSNPIFGGANTAAGFYLGFLSGSSDFLAFNAALANATTLGLTVITTNDVVGGTTSFSLASAAPTVNATPEPASLVLLGTGLMGVFGVSRRKSRRA